MTKQNQKFNDSIAGECINLVNARKMVNGIEYFTAIELDSFIPMYIDTNLSKTTSACEELKSVGFLKVWGRKHNRIAYELNIAL